MSWYEYQDKTIYELTAELEGYNGRWEERWFPWRRLLTMLHNIHSSEEDRMLEREYMPFPSDAKQIELDERVNALMFTQSVLPKNYGR